MGERHASSGQSTISVVIPALDEEAEVAATLRSVADADERILVDGGSRDHTREIAQAEGVRVLTSAPSRGGQMAAGARSATGDWLLFLHADTRLDPGWRSAILELPPGVASGAFRLAIDASGAGYRLVEAMVRLRCAVLRLPFGDQGLLVRRAAYLRVGGFAPIPLLEDVDLVRRLRKAGRLVFLKERALTSPRRWRRHGLVGTTLRNWSIQALYALGVPPERLARTYQRRRR